MCPFRWVGKARGQAFFSETHAKGENVVCLVACETFAQRFLFLWISIRWFFFRVPSHSYWFESAMHKEAKQMSNVVIRSKRHGKRGHSPTLWAKPRGRVLCNRFGKARACGYVGLWRHWGMMPLHFMVIMANYLSTNPNGNVNSKKEPQVGWSVGNRGGLWILKMPLR